MNHRSCDEALTNVYTYLDRELSSWRAWRIRRHLRACDHCCAAFGFEERLRVVIRSRLQEDVPPEFLERLRQVLRTDQTET
jgi:anti-sigma factor (TIGR02949 family)